MQVGWVKTGVDGLDRLLQGGFVEGSSVVLIGPVGTLKSFIGYQFIYNGLRRGERCLCISTHQSLDTLTFQLKSNFGWGVETYVDRGLLDFIYYPTYVDPLNPRFNVEVLGKVVEEAISRMEKGVRRLLVYALSPFFATVGDQRLVLNLVYGLNVKAKENRTVVFYIIDSGVQDRRAEEAVKSICDYVLETRENKTLREIRIVRGLLKHGLEWNVIRLTNNGVDVEVRI